MWIDRTLETECNLQHFRINPIQNGRPTSFSPVTSANVGINPQNFLTFILILFPHWCKISSLRLMPALNY